MARSVFPPAELKSSKSDVVVPDVLFPRIPPFSAMKSTAKLANFPGAVVIRRFRKGDVICRQGDAGWTAFYIPTPKELAEIREAPRKQLADARAEMAKAEAKVADLEKQIGEAGDDRKKVDGLTSKRAEAHEQVEEIARRIEVFLAAIPYLEREIVVSDAGDDSQARAVASVQLTIRSARRARPKGLLARVQSMFSGKSSDAGDRHPSSIPIDAPRNLDYETREGVLQEGELFGEMSCLYRSPRSATVVALRDCYMLEMLRNVLDAMNRDQAFKARLDQTYRERVLGLQLRNIPILNPLDDRVMDMLCKGVELVDVPCGELLYDENERSDGMHLIRSGVVKVLKDASFLLGEGDVTDWLALRLELTEGRDAPDTPKGRLRSLLHDRVREALDAEKGEELADGLKREFIAALNELLKDPELESTASLEDIARDHRIGLRVWQILATPAKSSEREMLRCQRRLLEAVYERRMPEWKPGEADELLWCTFRADEFRDWKAFGASVVDSGAKDGPGHRVWERLPEPARAALRTAKEGKELSAEEKASVVEALNRLLRGRPLLLHPEFHALARSKKGARIPKEFLPDNNAWSEYDFHRYNRAYNRLLLDAVFPKGLGTARRPVGPPRTLVYRSRGEAIGEMSLILGGTRVATCVAYGHPEDDPEREVGPVQLVRISQELFERLKAQSPDFFARVTELVAKRKAEEVKKLAAEPLAKRSSLPHPGRAEDLGLLQGQRLMLIDLERCTRCDECVRACVDTHDDGRSRLFLDGPRFGKYLVPATCRSCLDPVCMIGCPVGSIHRGGNGEILIEDWCIGCEACANQCPYGAIQMHTVGLVPGASFGWQYAPASRVPADWFRPGARSRGWTVGHAPFTLDREFRTTLEGPSREAGEAVRSITFRYEFELPAGSLDPKRELVLGLNSMDETLALWLNGRPVLAQGAGAEPDVESSRKKSRDRGWWEFEAVLPSSRIREGRNVLAVLVATVNGASDRLLDAWLDYVEGATVKLVEQKAVVCDLCSDQFGKRPACVTACPHDAAIRIDALAQLPTLP